MQVPALKDGGGTELRWRLTFLFVILKQPCGAKGEYLSRNAQRSLKSSSEQLEYWQLHAQTLLICGDRLEKVLTSLQEWTWDTLRRRAAGGQAR